MTSPDARLDRSISIHALREEGDEVNFAGLVKATVFLSTPSARRATSSRRPERRSKRFLSTPSARRATKLPPRKRSSQKNFYPRPPRGGRLQRQLLWHLQERFLSTPSARRATRRSPSSHRKTAISIHALREEGDLVPPCRAGDHQAISIHALREECWQAPCWPHQYFYPRPPRGGRRRLKPIRMRRTDFYPRPPRGGRPRRGRCSRSVMLISIHALREEGDVLGIGQSWPDGDFYPRPPRGGRPILAALLTYALRNFYPRPPRGGRQHIDELREIAVEISIHALREEGDMPI